MMANGVVEKNARHVLIFLPVCGKMELKICNTLLKKNLRVKIK